MNGLLFCRSFVNETRDPLRDLAAFVFLDTVVF